LARQFRVDRQNAAVHPHTFCKARGAIMDGRSVVNPDRCEVCGRRLRNAFFCAVCGKALCRWECYARHVARHTLPTPDDPERVAEQPPARINRDPDNLDR
jgi:hypothetical protein